MKRIYSNENNLMVKNAQNLLHCYGIESTIKNGDLSGSRIGVGNIWSELWLVNEVDEAKAKQLILDSENTPGDEWMCPACDETNGAAFEICWNCQAEKAS